MYNVRDEAPVQNSQRDRTKSEMLRPSPPKPVSNDVVVFSHSVFSDAVSAGVTLSTCQHLEDLILKMENQREQIEIANEQLKIAKRNAAKV